MAAHQEIIKATVESGTVQGAQDHCQSLGMDLFTPTNPGQVQKMRDLGFPSEADTEDLTLIGILLTVSLLLYSNRPYKVEFSLCSTVVKDMSIRCSLTPSNIHNLYFMMLLVVVEHD